jgi:hypothetical protein
MTDKAEFVGVHGADKTPVEEGVYPTPAQLLAMILYSDENTRIRICTSMLEADLTAHRCLDHNHVGELEFRRQHIVQLQQELNATMQQLSQMYLEANATAHEVVGFAAEDVERGELGQIIIGGRGKHAASDQDE